MTPAKSSNFYPSAGKECHSAKVSEEVLMDDENVTRDH